MRVLLTGAKGQLGQSLSTYMPSDWVVLAADKILLDIANEQNVYDVISYFKPDVVINTAAFTSVDDAEKNVDVSKQVNFLGAKYVAQAAKKYGAKLIHVSTDYVFDGKSTVPYTEEDKVKSLNVYGSTKHLGELAVLENHSDAIVIRTSWVYSEYGKNFLRTIFNFVQRNKDVKVVFDQIGAPTYAPDIAKLIIDIIKENRLEPGIYHYSGDTVMSWYDFAQKIAEAVIISHSKVERISSAEYKAEAERPSYSVLNCDKIEKLGYKRSCFAKGFYQSISALIKESK
ncbi:MULTISPECIES: dTDP-4-dehydrorhamnose reductase [Kosakonia]|uniref:dTDP-4-dehydrorhamnose reductase n=1 Tax=Kosakonia TaxID=1330547 RepID=UPI0005EF8AE0|nr:MULTISPECIES: dTDP-4-dehydrorhamnose reductase [Kosakonia]QHM94284.1 dTDP-4-dehydrorhamnose reductase [Kosakonia sacchari]RCX01741.1 dTDP-4-dehydrorhamnose reductase [Kosakonia sp. AG348]